MSRKLAVKGFLAVDSEDATAVIKSEITSVSTADSAAYYITFSAPNTGVFTVQARSGYYQIYDTESGWFDLDFGGALAVTAETEVVILVQDLTFADMRLVWTPSAGSGTISAKLSMKVLGA